MSSILEAIRRSEAARQQADQRELRGPTATPYRRAPMQSRLMLAGFCLVFVAIATGGLMLWQANTANERPDTNQEDRVGAGAPSVSPRPSSSEVATTGPADYASPTPKPGADQRSAAIEQQSVDLPLEVLSTPASDAGVDSNRGAADKAAQSAEGTTVEALPHSSKEVVAQPASANDTRSAGSVSSAGLARVRAGQLGISVTAFVYSEQDAQAFLLSGGRRLGIDSVIADGWVIVGFEPAGALIEKAGQRKLLELGG